MDTEQTTTTNKRRLPESTKSLIAGGVGGIGLTAAGYPFDLVKVRLQTAAPGTYTGMLNCAAKIIRTDGLAGLYRGATPVFLGVIPIFAILFWAYDESQKLAVDLWGGEMRRISSPNLVDRLSLSQVGFAGGLSAVPTTILMGPAERIKVLLQIQEKGSAKYTGALDAVSKVVKSGGLRSLFRGTWLTLLRDSPGSVAYFGIFEAAKRWLQGADSSKKLGSGVVLCGALAGAANWIVIMPVDRVKSQLQATEGAGPTKGMWDAFSTIYRNEGVKGLFTGLGPALLRAIPANAAAFTCVEATRKFLDKY